MIVPSPRYLRAANDRGPDCGGLTPAAEAAILRMGENIERLRQVVDAVMGHHTGPMVDKLRALLRQLHDALDAMEADPEAEEEPDAEEGDAPEDGADAEPWLGAPEGVTGWQGARRGGGSDREDDPCDRDAP